MRTFLIFFCVSSLLWACRDEPSPEPIVCTPPPDSPCVTLAGNPCHIYKIETDYGTDVSKDEFQLDELNRIVGLTRSDKNGIVVYASTFVYNNDGLLSNMINTYPDNRSAWYIIYTSTGKIDEVRRHNGGIVYRYDEVGRISRYIAYSRVGPELRNYHVDLTYHDGSCANVKEAAPRWEHNPTKYAYDDKRSVWSLISLYLHGRLDYSVNNKLAEQNSACETINYSYEYNVYGYPTKCTVTDASGGIHKTYTFFYRCD